VVEVICREDAGQGLKVVVVSFGEEPEVVSVGDGVALLEWERAIIGHVDGEAEQMGTCRGSGDRVVMARGAEPGGNGGVGGVTVAEDGASEGDEEVSEGLDGHG
jgi:hypothetical protein